MKIKNIDKWDLCGLEPNLKYFDWYDNEYDNGNDDYEYGDYEYGNSQPRVKYVKYGSRYDSMPSNIIECIPVYSIHITRRNKIEEILNDKCDNTNPI